MSNFWTITEKNHAQKNHAQECDSSFAWVQTYKAGKDEQGNIPAFEFRCTKHNKNFWLAVPNDK